MHPPTSPERLLGGSCGMQISFLTLKPGRVHRARWILWMTFFHGFPFLVLQNKDILAICFYCAFLNIKSSDEPHGWEVYLREGCILPANCSPATENVIWFLPLLLRVISESKNPSKGTGKGSLGDTWHGANEKIIRKFSLWGISFRSCTIKCRHLGPDAFPVWSEDLTEWRGWCLQLSFSVCVTVSVSPISTPHSLRQQFGECLGNTMPVRSRLLI